MAISPQAARGLPATFWYLFAGALINRLGGFVMIVLVFYLRAERGFSIEEAGLVVAIHGAGSLLAGPLGGALADRLGRRPTLVASLMLGALATACLGWSQSALAIEGAALALGLFGEMYRPAVSAAVADVIPAADRQRAFGLIYWAVNLGFSFAAVAAGMLGSVSFRLAFALDAATTLAFGAIVLVRVPETRPAKRDAPTSSPSRPPFSDTLFMAFVVVSLLLGIVFMQSFAPLPLDMATHGVTTKEFGYLLAINGVMIVVLQPALSARIGRHKPARALAFGAVLIGAGYGACAFVRSIPAYAVTIGVWTLGEIVMAPVGPAVVSELAPAGRRGAYQGAYQLAWGGSAFLAPLVGSSLLARFGSLGLWGSCFVACLAAGAGFLALGPHIERRLASRRDQPSHRVAEGRTA